jgi:tetratricopeptide (TPR) repeat protein
MSEQVDILLHRADQARRDHRPADAKPELEKALDTCRRSGTKVDLARILKALGQVERDMRHPEIALPLYEEAASIYRSEDDALALAHTIRHVGDIQQNLALFKAAEGNYREALAIYRAHPETSKLDLANAIRGLAILTFDTGKNEEAKLLWHEARELYAAVNVEPGVKESSRRLALLETR